MGNSCYLASVCQILFCLDEVQARYGSVAKDLGARREDDVLAQVRKVVNCMRDGYTCPGDGQDDDDDPRTTVMPSMLKKAVAKGSEDFATGQQQDAAEYFRWIINKVSAHEPAGSATLGGLFGFEVEGRKRCDVDGKVRYTSEAENVLMLPVPKEKVKWEEGGEQDSKKMKVEGDCDKKKPLGKLSLYDCLDSFCSETIIMDYEWSHLGGRAGSTSSQGFKNFPKYLALAVGRYEVGPDWQPKKIEVDVDVPLELDIEKYRAKRVEGDVEAPEDGPSGGGRGGGFIADASALEQITGMGFGGRSFP